MTQLPTPPEFFRPEELRAMFGHSRTNVIAALTAARVPFILGRDGWPLVYRNKLLPGAANEDHNSNPSDIDFSAIHASRPAAHRAKP